MKVYLAGQWNKHDNNWKKLFDLPECKFHDPEIHSDQTSPDTYFPEDLQGVRNADIMIANPGVAPSEGTWIEIGYFYATHVQVHGDRCENLIIVWQDGRAPRWSFDFVNKTGIVVATVEEARERLKRLITSS